MIRIQCQQVVLVESEIAVTLGTEWYVPIEAVRLEYLRANGKLRYCHWKGEADTYDLVIGDTVLRDAAWCLARPFWEAMEAKGMFAFDPTQVQIEA